MYVQQGKNGLGEKNMGSRVGRRRNANKRIWIEIMKKKTMIISSLSWFHIWMETRGWIYIWSTPDWWNVYPTFSCIFIYFSPNSSWFRAYKLTFLLLKKFNVKKLVYLCARSSSIKWRLATLDSNRTCIWDPKAARLNFLPEINTVNVNRRIKCLSWNEI